MTHHINLETITLLNGSHSSREAGIRMCEVTEETGR